MNKVIDILIWDITTNKRLYSLQALGTLGGMLAIMMVPILLGFDNYAYFGSWVIIGIKTLINYAYYTSLSVPFDGKQNRISMLMLPASMMQKFLARLIFVLILVPIATVVIAFAADALHLILSTLIRAGDTSDITSYSPFIFVNILNDFEFTFGNIIDDKGATSNWLISSIHICFILYGLACGAVWTRRALLKSIGLGIIIYIFLFIVFLLCIDSIIYFVIILWLMNGFMAYKIYNAFINRELAGR